MRLQTPTQRFWKSSATRLITVWLALYPVLTHAELPPDHSSVKIHRYAAFNQQLLAATNKPSPSAVTQSATQRSQVSVYGRDLVLNMQSNAALLGPQPGNLNNIALLRGHLEGAPASWVRLTHTSAGVQGLIWDGAELYAIEPGAQVRNQLADSLPIPTSPTVIFKLSDTTIDVGNNYCSSNSRDEVSGPRTGLATYQALAAEMTPQSHNSSVAVLRLEMEVLADAAFRAQYASDQAAAEAIIVRLNNIDGIYSSQLNLSVQATDIRLYAQDPAALSTSSDAGTLLNSLGQMRATTPGMASYAATHLLTGRDLDGDTLGVAYIGNLCESQHAASLSESRYRGAWFDSLVAAHELGHQLGAVHDGTGMCADSEADGFLMSALITGSDTISSCSRDAMFATMHYATCLVPLELIDIGAATGGNASNAATATQDNGGGSLGLNWLLLLTTLAGWRMRCLFRRAA